MSNIGNSANIIKYKSAVAALRKADDPLRLAHAVRHLGDAYHYAGRVSLADACYVEALSIYRSHESSRPLDLANAIRSFAVLKDEAGAEQEAQRLWQEAHDLYVSVNVPAGIAESAARLALLAQRQGDLQGSREWLDGALKAANTADDADTLQYVREVKVQIER
jgi:tetratricopeptide (TPR) repeat protein